MEYLVVFHYEELQNRLKSIPLSDIVTIFIKTVKEMISSDTIIYGVNFGWLVRMQPFDDITYFCFVQTSLNLIRTTDLGNLIRQEANTLLYNTPSSCLVRRVVE